MELAVLNLGYDLGFIPAPPFSMLVLHDRSEHSDDRTGGFVPGHQKSGTLFLWERTLTVPLSSGRYEIVPCLQKPPGQCWD